MNREKNSRHPVVFELLKIGKENAISCGELCRMNDIRSLRAIVTEVERLIDEDGEVICACTLGYFRPANAQELEEYIQSRKRRAKHTAARTALLVKALKEMQKSTAE